MKSHAIVWQTTKVVALGQLLCCAALVGIYALIGKCSPAVALGAGAGGLLATANFFTMALCADLAVDKGPALVSFSYPVRMAALLILLALYAKSGAFDLIALVLPFLFTRPILTIREIKSKKGGDQP